MNRLIQHRWPNDELLAIVDGNNLVMRAYFAMQNHNLTTSEGVPTGALFGSILAHINVVRTLNPTKMVWFFDARGGSTARKEMFAGYKADRPGNHAIGKQLSAFETFLSTMDVRYYSEDGVEADDLIAEAVNRWDEDVPKVIVSGDHDFHQLVRSRPRVSVLKPGQGKRSPAKAYSYRAVREEYGMDAERLLDAWSICGDKSDNIPGVKGIGFKTARKILARNNWSLEEAMKNEPRLAGWEETVYLNRRLIGLGTGDIEVALPVELEECRLEKDNYDSEGLQKFLHKWEISSLRSKEKSIGIYG